MIIESEDAVVIRRVWLRALLALGLLTALFIVSREGQIDFFWGMALTVIVLVLAASTADGSLFVRIREDLRENLREKLLLGVLSAVFLYAVFFAGDLIAQELVPHASSDIQSIYALGSGLSALRVALLIALVIGPGEEIFWRGYVQHSAEKMCGSRKGVLVTTAVYVAVHLAAANLMLLLAALVCGLFWGVLYLWKRSVIANVTSPLVWDLAVFIFVPFR